jgi:hypothetical protein
VFQNERAKGSIVAFPDNVRFRVQNRIGTNERTIEVAGVETLIDNEIQASIPLFPIGL